MIDEKHIFAIYFNLINEHNPFEIKIADEHLVHRIKNVLRLKVNDKIILFNQNFNILTKIINYDKKNILLEIIQKIKNKKFKTNISIFVSMLKKDALEQAIYYCTELGANNINLVFTQKTNKKNIDEKELKRFEKIIIAAAEQSKNFNMPKLFKPVAFEKLKQELNDKKNCIKLYFDVNGKKISDVLNQFSQSSYNEILLMIGPEGDLTNLEKKSLIESDFKFCSLTPTTLRSQTAVAISLGIIRSFFD